MLELADFAFQYDHVGEPGNNDRAAFLSAAAGPRVLRAEGTPYASLRVSLPKYRTVQLL